MIVILINHFSGFYGIATNVLALGDGGDFQHKTSYEAPNFKFSENCHTKH
jgi:hypothetical protein